VLTGVIEAREPSEYLFPAADGGPMRNSYLRWRLDKACKTTGLIGISIKTLRHSAGSLALAIPGTSVVVVSRLLGHAKVSTTADIYTDMLPDDFDALSAAMDRP
jgi:integrase